MWHDRLNCRCDRLRDALDRMSRERLLRFLEFWHAARPTDRFRRDGVVHADDDMPTWVLRDHVFCVVTHRWMVRRADQFNRAWLIEHDPAEAVRRGLISFPKLASSRAELALPYRQAAE